MQRLANQLTNAADHALDAEALRIEACRLLEAAVGLERLLGPAEHEPDPHRYRQHILHVDPAGRFSVVALVWLPGQATPIHDHIAWCVTGVHAGCEVEQRYEPLSPSGNRPRMLRPTVVALNAPGTVSSLPPLGRDIHRVRCAGDERAISLHIYGADITRLGTSINVVYDENCAAGVTGNDAGPGHENG